MAMIATAAAVSQRRYADLGLRFAARLVDDVIVGGLVYTIIFLGTATRMPTVEVLALLVGLLAGIGYWVAFPALTSATPGKAALRLRIIGPDDARRGIGWGIAFKRWLGTYASAIPLCIGYIAIAIDPERQGWHDKIAGTHVLNENSRR